jgi:hypothetical protein
MNALTLPLRRFGTTLFLLLFFISPTISQFVAMRDSAIFKRQSSSTIRLMTNSNGVLGNAAFPTDSILRYFDPRYVSQYREQSGLEYPLGSNQEHLIAGGLWVGAIINNLEGRRQVVSCTVCDNAQRGEFLGHRFPGDTFYVANGLAPNSPARRFIDDDGDGLVDEDPLDGFDNDGDWSYVDDLNRNLHPDHGEPHVDEDGDAVSENEIYVVYRDSFPLPRIAEHTRLGIRVWQKSYGWKELVKEPILPIEYYVINAGQLRLDSVYLGFYAQILLGPYAPKDVGDGNNFLIRRRLYEQKFLLGVQTLALSATANGIQNITPVGITYLGSSLPLGDVQLTARTISPFISSTDSLKYNVMASGVIDSDTTFGPTRTFPELLLSVGPFRNFTPGDTLRFAIALVSGERMSVGFNSINDNAQKALEIAARDFKPPNFPVSPPLKISQIKNGVILNWKWNSGDTRPNPEETWDDDNKYVSNLPETHWRRQNPPPGKSSGGRIFEGYRVWRSDVPILDEKAFSLLYQYDVDDDLGFEQQTGIEYQYVDTPIVRGKKYWYAVTSFTVPDYYIGLDTLSEGVYVPDTIQTPAFSSPLFENAKLFQLPFTPSYTLGEVKVVPNPYRTDQDYTFEGGGWEGLGRLWSEYRRQIWFTHLPPKCTIRIFTIMGEVVSTLYHDDAVRIPQGFPEGQEEWYLLSDSNRAIASGVYVFLVESEYGTQTGKFVVIR